MTPEKMEDKLDKILEVVIRTETEVKEIKSKDLHTRVVKLESAHKFWKTIALATPPVVGCILGALRYFKV